MPDSAATLVAAINASLAQNLAQIRRCVGLLGPQRAWQRANEHCNSVANLVIHLNGNVTQWICAGLGGETARRDRPAEFAARSGDCAAALDDLRKTVARASQVIAGLTADRLAQEYEIQGYRVRGIAAAYHVGEHFSFHTGQIVHITKAVCDVDLSLYDAHGRPVAREGDAPW